MAALQFSCLLAQLPNYPSDALNVIPGGQTTRSQGSGIERESGLPCAVSRHGGGYRL